MFQKLIKIGAGGWLTNIILQRLQFKSQYFVYRGTLIRIKCKLRIFIISLLSLCVGGLSQCNSHRDLSLGMKRQLQMI